MFGALKVSDMAMFTKEFILNYRLDLGVFVLLKKSLQIRCSKGSGKKAWVKVTLRTLGM